MKIKYIIKEKLKKSKKINILINNFVPYRYIAVKAKSSCLYLYSFDDYFDHWNFFYTVDSNISNQETWQRHYHGDKGDYFMREAFPWVFTYFTKYVLKFIGYSVENTHYFLLSFSIISIFIFYKLSDFLSKDFNIIITAY